MKLTFIVCAILGAGSVVVGCKDDSSTPPPTTAASTGPPPAPKTDGGNKPAVGPVGIKGTDLKNGGSDPGFGAKGK